MIQDREVSSQDLFCGGGNRALGFHDGVEYRRVEHDQQV
jgi:hemin uptake protein HemP